MDLTINSYDISEIGFKVIDGSGTMPIAARKLLSGEIDAFSSENYYPIKSIKETSEFSILLFGNYATINLAESALHILIGKLSSVGEKTFVFSKGTNSETIKGIMSKGIKSDYILHPSGIAFKCEIKCTRTND